MHRLCTKADLMPWVFSASQPYIISQEPFWRENKPPSIHTFPFTKMYMNPLY